MMSQQGLEQLRQLVLQDGTLQQRLRETPDRDHFFALVLQLAREHGYDVAVEDVEHALQVSRRAWFERSR